MASQTQLYLGLFEREVYGWIKTFSQNINTAIDIGTDEGEYALYFLMKTLAKQVFAFEPGAKGQKQLSKNLELNSISDSSRLIFSDKFVSSVDNDDSCTLDALLPLISTPCLIKMDVDGGEVDILRGSARLLDLPDIRWIIETHSQLLEKQCIEILTEAGFTTTIIPNAWWRVVVPELRPIAHNRWLVAIKTQ